MTEDTPTERFDPNGEEVPAQPAGADVPTQRMDAADLPEDPGGADLPTQRMDAADASAVGGAAGAAGAGAVFAPHVPVAAATPTERFAAPATAPVAAPPPPGDGEGRSKRTILILSIVGGLLLLALLILLFMLLNRGAEPVAAPSATPSPTQTLAETPSASPTPSDSPSPTPTETETAPPPPPPSPDVDVTAFTATSEVDCSAQTQNPEYVEFSWTSVNGIAAYFGVNTSDAQAEGMGWTLPPSGSTSDFPSGYNPFAYQCSNGSMNYTITVVGTNGSKESRTVTVTNVGDTF